MTSQGSHGAFLTTRTFASLDGLRALSILAVIWHHSEGAQTLAPWFPAAKYGFLGVDLFFVISGFLIVTLLLREQSRWGDVNLRDFYMRRALRIFPLYYGLLLACSVLFFAVRPSGETAAHFRNDLPVLALYLANWVPATGMFAIAWSLAAEEQFYLVWPAIEKWLSRWAVPLVLLVLSLSQAIQLGLVDPLLAAAFGWSRDEPAMLRETTFTPICLGVLLAHGLHDPASYERIRRWLGPRWVAPALLVGLVVATCALPDDIRGLGRPSVQLMMTALVAACVVREDHALRRPLTLAPIARIGALSYGLYLLHHPVIAVVKKGLSAAHLEAGLLAALVRFAAAVLLTMVAAEISYRCYEVHFLRAKAKFTGRASPG